MRLHVHMGLMGFVAIVLSVLALAVVAYVLARVAWLVHGERVRTAVRRVARRWS